MIQAVPRVPLSRLGIREPECELPMAGKIEGLKRFNNYSGPTEGREEWFSLGENHEKVLCFGLHQLLNRF
jgi:hypothetical protein